MNKLTAIRHAGEGYVHSKPTPPHDDASGDIKDRNSISLDLQGSLFDMAIKNIKNNDAKPPSTIRLEGLSLDDVLEPEAGGI